MKKIVHCLQDLHSMLLLYHLSLIKNEQTHTHISSCLWLIFSFFEYVCIRFLPISKPSTWCFLCLDHPALGSSKGQFSFFTCQLPYHPRKIILVHTICLYPILITLYTASFHICKHLLFHITFGLVYVSITYLLLLENRSHKNRYFIFLILMLSF